MSLGRLLTSGKSLVGLNHDEGRYQMRAKNLLPKFGSGKNPFLSAKRQGTPAAPAPVKAPPVEPQSLQSEFSRRLPVPTAKVAEAPVGSIACGAKPTQSAASTDTKGLKPGVVEKLVGFLKKLNPMNWRKAKSSSAVPRFDKAPVQTELSLDRIKVVRNDLNEADVEIVPVKIAVQPRPENVEVKVASARPTTPELIKT
jgi:hypothetical protein